MCCTFQLSAFCRYKFIKNIWNVSQVVQIVFNYNYYLLFSYTFIILFQSYISNNHLAIGRYAFSSELDSASFPADRRG